MNFPFVFLQTFYRETINASKMSKTMTLKSEQNLFMPNFSTKNSDDPDEEINSSNNMSVISQWDKLPSADSEPDESFSEMKPTKVIYQKVLTRKLGGKLAEERGYQNVKILLSDSLVIQSCYDKRS